MDAELAMRLQSLTDIKSGFDLMDLKNSADAVDWAISMITAQASALDRMEKEMDRLVGLGVVPLNSDQIALFAAYLHTKRTSSWAMSFSVDDEQGCEKAALWFIKEWAAFQQFAGQVEFDDDGVFHPKDVGPG